MLLGLGIGWRRYEISRDPRTLKDADLRGSDLSQCVLDEAILWRADLQEEHARPKKSALPKHRKQDLIKPA